MLVRNQSKLFIKSVFLVLIQQPNTVFKLKSLGFLIKALGFLLQTMQIQSKFQISTTDLHFYSKSLISTPNPGVLLQIPDFYSNPGFLLQIWDFYSSSGISTPNLGFLLQIREFYSNWEDFYSKSRIYVANSELILKIPELSMQNYFKYNLFVCLGFCLFVCNL